MAKFSNTKTQWNMQECTIPKAAWTTMIWNHSSAQVMVEFSNIFEFTMKKHAQIHAWTIIICLYLRINIPMVRNFKVTTVWTLEYHLNVHFGAGSGLLCYQTFSHIWNNWMVFPFFAPFHGFLVRPNPQKPCHIESSWMAVHMNDRFHGSLVLLSSQKPFHI